jgi:hypothetical protein
MTTPSFISLSAGTLDRPKQGKSITSMKINLLRFQSSYNFIIILHINSLQTFELHMQPLPYFMNSTDFKIKRFTVLCNFNSVLTLTTTISKLPADGAEAPKHVGTFVIYFNIYISEHLLVQINNYHFCASHNSSQYSD